MASNKYIPPALRNKSTSGMKASEFPALTSFTPTSNTSWKHKTSFAVLASEWQEQSEEEAFQRDLQLTSEKRELDKRLAEERMFVTRKRPVDDIYEEYAYDEEEADTWTPSNTDGDNWKTIERKPRKELTIDEKFAKEQKQEEEEKRAQLERDSVWDASGTEWDYRDRRTIG